MGKPERIPPPESEHQAIFETWGYEWWMLGETLRLLGVWRTDSRDEVYRNAMLESFLIHVRNLIEFYSDDPKLDDVVARDLTTRPDWLDEDGIASLTDLQAGLPTIHKWLAHLTLTRIRTSKPDHAVQRLYTQLATVTRAFVRALPSEFASQIREQ